MIAEATQRNQDCDLFGVEAKLILSAAAQKRRNADMPRGSFAPIGSGPAGETCKTCKHSYCRKMGNTYWKCDLVKATGSPKTDIRLKWAACRGWEKK